MNKTKECPICHGTKIWRGLSCVTCSGTGEIRDDSYLAQLNYENN